MTMRLSFLILFAAGLLFGCDRINRDPYSDTPTTGIIKIGADETFRTITDAELMVFGDLYRYAKITPVYKTENLCVQMLLDDSVHLIISYRKLYEDEKEVFNKQQINIHELKIATDAVAVLVNPENADTLLSMNQLKGILTGEIKQWDQLGGNGPKENIDLIFDNKNSSIVRYMLDSVCTSTSLSPNSFAMDSTVDVVNYVANHKFAIGFIGVSMVSDSDDTTQLSFLKKINVVALSESAQATVDNSYKPYQAYIYQGFYPLRRDVYVVNAEPRSGLATGFTSFLTSDKGQRIILKSGIIPAVAPIRIVNVRDRI
jgi:phosphate transport system substrate-binding protein